MEVPLGAGPSLQPALSDARCRFTGIRVMECVEPERRQEDVGGAEESGKGGGGGVGGSGGRDGKQAKY